MRWKTILRVGIIIYIFFLITIKCKTNVMAMSGTEIKFILIDNFYKKILTDISLYDKINNTIKVFSGNFDKGQIVCTEYLLSEKLKETDEELLTRLLKIPVQGEDNDILGVPDDSYIENIEINLEGNSALINMSQDYQLTNYGVLGEYLALQSLIKTVADYYNVEEVLISVDGKPYCSGHFCFEEIDMNNTIK